MPVIYLAANQAPARARHQSRQLCPGGDPARSTLQTALRLMCAPRVLKYAGARPAARDTVDARIVSQAAAGSLKIIDSPADVGGLPDQPPVQQAAEIPTAPFDPSGQAGLLRIEAWLCQRHLDLGGQATPRMSARAFGLSHASSSARLTREMKMEQHDDKVWIGGVPVDRLTSGQWCQHDDHRLAAQARDDPRRPRSVTTVNGQVVSLFTENRDFREAVLATDHIAADGMSVVFASTPGHAKSRCRNGSPPPTGSTPPPRPLRATACVSISWAPPRK